MVNNYSWNLDTDVDYLTHSGVDGMRWELETVLHIL